MPRHPTARKDAASCEKPRGGASDLGSGDVRMGEPNRYYLLPISVKDMRRKTQ